VPDFAKQFLGRTLFHSSQFAIQDCNFSDKTILVVGGGQSGAE
jgi:lysine/ornithine N-monooxygenase